MEVYPRTTGTPPEPARPASGSSGALWQLPHGKNAGATFSTDAGAFAVDVEGGILHSSVHALTI